MKKHNLGYLGFLGLLGFLGMILDMPALYGFFGLYGFSGRFRTYSNVIKHDESGLFHDNASALT